MLQGALFVNPLRYLVSYTTEDRQLLLVRTLRSGGIIETPVYEFVRSGEARAEERVAILPRVRRKVIRVSA